MNYNKILQNNLIPFDMKSYDSYKKLIMQIGSAKIVMLGESTHEFYSFSSSI